MTSSHQQNQQSGNEVTLEKIKITVQYEKDFKNYYAEYFLRVKGKNNSDKNDLKN